MREYYVYMYSDPSTGVPFYIGKGTASRHKRHLRKSHNEHLNRKIAKIRELGLEPVVEKVFKTTSEDVAYSVEMHMIMSYGLSHLGGLLCNQDLGGDGTRTVEYDKSFYERLGVVSDYVLGEEYGCSHSNVGIIRKSLGIPPFRERSPDYEFSPEVVEKMGTIPDKKLSEICGIPVHAIQRYRAKHNIQNTRDFEGCVDKRLHRFVKDDLVFEGTREEFKNHIDAPRGNIYKVMTGERKTVHGWSYGGLVDE